MKKHNFLIVGSANAVTSGIHEYLKQHTDAFMTDWKELCFFKFKDLPPPKNTTDTNVRFCFKL